MRLNYLCIGLCVEIVYKIREGFFLSLINSAPHKQKSDVEGYETVPRWSTGRDQSLSYAEQDFYNYIIIFRKT